ncbi:MAG TPA: alcohol dehydrogenase catalytic domain-containing protein [Pseudonocardiaceae bacterium]|nr:alcohol dehydrogenase catalytic domain-containing protein [Pseudonocardiaceae bacterium]
MKAVVWSGPGQIDLEDVAGARLEQSTDAVVRLTMSAICGTDLHMVRGTTPGKQPGTVLGHEGVGVVEAVGSQFRGSRDQARVAAPLRSRPRRAAPNRRRGRLHWAGGPVVLVGSGHHPRARHSARKGRSAPRVESSPCPG